jgi:uncharacterized protein YacL (UPF0231 family)
VSLELAALSFFKKNKIPYNYRKPIITFPCSACAAEAVMHAVSTKWECTGCKKTGTIAVLIQEKKEQWEQSKLYDPDKEKRKILKSLEEVMLRHNDRKLENAIEKLEKLLTYYGEKEAN